MNVKEVLLPFGKKIYQSEKGHGITHDTANLVEIILKNHFNEEKNVLDLGSGNGIIAIMLAWNRNKWSVLGIEIQKNLFELANLNKKRLNLANVNFLNEDLNEFESDKKFDLIVINPPFFPKSSGKISPIEERAVSRQEIKTNMEKILVSISRNLAKTGIAYIIYPTKRLEEFSDKIKKIDLIALEKKIILQSSKTVILKLKKG